MNIIVNSNVKKRLYILIIVIVFLECCAQTIEKKKKENAKNSEQTELSSSQQQNIYIKDQSLYDPKFINGLYNYKEQIKLIKNYIIIDTDTTYFPENIKLNKTITFTGFKDNNKYLLVITRTNLTNIKYKFQLLNKENGFIENKSGEAILTSGFFLAPEGEPDTETGASFVSNEYYMNNDSTWLILKVGIDSNFKDKGRAKVMYGHKDKFTKAEEVKESPILRLE